MTRRLPLKRVVLLGAEYTGKTTLARRLAAHYGTAWVPEYARTFVEQTQAPPAYRDVAAIARGHLDAVDALRARATRVLIGDTDLVATCLYSDYYFGDCPAWVRRASYDHQADLYLLTATDIPWLPDPGQRDSPDARDRLQALFTAELIRRAVPYVEVAGSPDERFRTAAEAIDRIL